MSSISTSMNSTEPAPIDRKKLLLSGGAVVVSMLVLTFVVVRLFSGGPSPGDVSRYRTVMDAETGEIITGFEVEEGTLYPWKNPKSGKNTLYLTETCFWTKDGKAKTEPTLVLLNETIGKSGPTMCPDCGKPVVLRNPKPPHNLMLEAYKARAAKDGK
jgi:hypothetical protein